LENPEESARLTPAEVRPKRIRLIVGLVVVAIVAASLAAFFLLFKPMVGLGGIPVYVGAAESKELTGKSQQEIGGGGFTGFEIAVYKSPDSSSTIASWYRAEMIRAGWTKENETSSSSYGGRMAYFFLFKRGGDGAMIMVGPISLTEEATGIVIVFGELETIKAIMYYLSEQKVYAPRVVAGMADGRIIDYNPGAPENYKNGDLAITVRIIAGGLRDVGNPTYGFLVRLDSPRTGQSFVVGLGAGNNDAGITNAVENYGRTITLVKTVRPAGWPSGAFKFTLRIPSTSAGTVPVGSAISIIGKGVELTTDDRTTFAEVWRDRDTINVVISGRDSLSLTGFDGAYLIGLSYIA